MAVFRQLAGTGRKAHHLSEVVPISSRSHSEELLVRVQLSNDGYATSATAVGPCESTMAEGLLELLLGAELPLIFDLNGSLDQTSVSKMGSSLISSIDCTI